MGKKKRVTTYTKTAGHTDYLHGQPVVYPGSVSKTKTVTRKKNVRTKTKSISTGGSFVNALLTKTRTVSAGSDKKPKRRVVSAKRAKRIRRRFHKKARR